MARKKKPSRDVERLHRIGLADPRTGRERLAGVINRAVQPASVRRQDRRYDDSPSKMARNVRAAEEAAKKRTRRKK